MAKYRKKPVVIEQPQQMHSYRIRWLDGSEETIEGYGVADAFRRAEYGGGGATRGLDWWKEVDVVESTSIHLLATLRAVEAERDRLEGLLKAVEAGLEDYCPICTRLMVPDHDHAPGCELRAALAPAPEMEA